MNYNKENTPDTSGNGLKHTKGAELNFMPMEPVIFSDTMRYWAAVPIDGAPRYARVTHKDDVVYLSFRDSGQLKRLFKERGVTYGYAAKRLNIKLSPFMRRIAGGEAFTVNQVALLNKMRPPKKREKEG